MPPHDKHLTFSCFLKLGCNAPGVCCNWLMPVQSRDGASKAHFQGWRRSFRCKRASLKGQTSIYTLFCKWSLQSAYLTISHLSSLSINLSAAWLQSAFVHAPFPIVSFFHDFSSTSSRRSLFFFFFCQVSITWCQAVKGLVELRRCRTRFLSLVLPLGASRRPKPASRTLPLQ